jgi:hypothetical protein
MVDELRGELRRIGAALRPVLPVGSIQATGEAEPGHKEGESNEQESSHGRPGKKGMVHFPKSLSGKRGKS